MITKSSDLIIIEGLVASHHARGENEAIRQRLEIDGRTGLIRAVGEPKRSGDLVLGDDHLIFPGFIDVHVHAREDSTSTQSYKEDFRSAGEAAIHGGVTAFADMPNNPRPPVDDASYAAKRELAKACPVDVLLYAGIGPRTKPLSFAAPYKAYMGPSIGELFFDSLAALRETLASYRGLTVAFHAESPEVLRQHQDAPTHAERRPPEAEIRAIEAAIAICESFQIEPHICHLSTAGGLDAIRRARRRGMHVTCEVAPHHLFYDLDNMASFAKPHYLQANPPIRSRLDRIQLLEAFRAGEIDYLATDHAPHALEENDAGISGIPHLDTFGPFIAWLRDEGASLRIIRLAAAERPGKFLSRYLGGPYGKVEKGFVGSLSILQEEPETVRRGALKTRAGWSPFEGQTFRARVSHTIVRGRIHPRVAG
jgi:dihydroorotase